MTFGRERRPLADRMASKTITGPDCWLWSGTKDSWGYGQIKVLGYYRQAHRVAFELANGPIQRGLFVCHRCDNPACVRPDHLFLGTPNDNHRDMMRKGRASFATGERHSQAKISARDAARIPLLYADGLSMAAIGERFGIHATTVSSVLRGRTWTKETNLTST